MNCFSQLNRLLQLQLEFMMSSFFKKYIQFNRYPYYLKMIWWRYGVPKFIPRTVAELGLGVKFYGMPIVSNPGGAPIHIGDNVTLCSNSEMTALGVSHPVILRKLSHTACLEIGAFTGISGAAICSASSVRIGERCLIGSNVIICDTDFHTLNPVGRYNDQYLENVKTIPVIIENDVFIGANSIVLKGVIIGENSVIGAGSVVTKNIPANTISCGNPARVIGSLV